MKKTGMATTVELHDSIYEVGNLGVLGHILTEIRVAVAPSDLLELTLIHKNDLRWRLTYRGDYTIWWTE